MTVCVLGGGGYIGSAVSNALNERGIRVLTFKAPRLTVAWGTATLWLDSQESQDLIVSMTQALTGCDAVVNCAGLASPGDRASPTMYGANALLPSMLDEARSRASVPRLVHVSSAAVQGDMETLDETSNLAPATPYGRSKAEGERLLLRRGTAGSVVFRATSVHGTGRATTARLASFAKSRLSSVAGSGEWPSPQSLVENLGAAVASLVSGDVPPPPIVLQPTESQTAVSVLRVLGLGREPHHLPQREARRLLATMQRVPANASMAAALRRLKLLWFGQSQVDSWLSQEGFVPPLGPEGWVRLANTIQSVPDTNSIRSA